MKIQDIIDKFKIKFPELYTTCDGREGYDYLAEDDVINFLQSSLTSLLDDIEKELPSSGQHHPLCHCQGNINERCNCGVYSKENYRREVIDIINSHK